MLISDSSSINKFDDCEDFNTIDFPTKAECKKSLLRKRRAMRVEYYKKLRGVRNKSFLYGPILVDKNGDYVDELFYAQYIKWSWRGMRSKYIKKQCIRRSRSKYKHKRYHNNDLSISRKRGLHRRDTEFWWAYD